VSLITTLVCRAKHDRADRHAIAPGRAPWTSYNLAEVLEKDDLEYVVSIDGLG
jgi:hypothetical protein